MRALAAVVLGLLSASAQASDITQKDIQVIGRTLGFLEDLPDSPLDVGILYIRNNPDAQHEAAQMQALLADAPMIGRVRLRPHPVTAEELATVDHLNAVFIVPAALQAAPQADATGRRLHIPVMSSDPACAQAGQCVLAFTSSPTVEITFNRSLAEAAGVRFTAAFRMLVKKL